MWDLHNKNGKNMYFLSQNYNELIFLNKCKIHIENMDEYDTTLSIKGLHLIWLNVYLLTNF